MKASRLGNQPTARGTKASAGGVESPSESTSPESRAERLLSEYLRAWGLRDPQTIARLSSHWARRAGDDAAGSAHKLPLAELYRRAMQQAMSDMDQWLDTLTGEACRDADDARSCRGLLAMEVQATIDQFPACLLAESGQLPTAFIEGLVDACPPVVPANHPTKMRTQSLDPVPPSKYLPAWLRAIWGRLSHRPAQTVPGPSDDRA
jgi:hypothetical protein